MKKQITGVILLASLVSAQQGVQTKINAKDQLPYVWIAAGKFTMGCSTNDHQCADDETPRHAVEITHGFWMGQTPVTVAAWKRFRAATGKPALPAIDEFGRKINEAAGDNQPVVSETWDEARSFCSWSGMRLPTEAEWEYAARAGRSLSNPDELDQVAWYGDNSGRKQVDSAEMFRFDPTKYHKKLFSNGNAPHDVKLKAPNAWGLYDMLGNVAQWVSDYYAPAYYSVSQSTDPTGPTQGTQRVLRGGSWNAVPNNVRISYRITNPPLDRVNTFGFRCVGDLP